MTDAASDELKRIVTRWKVEDDLDGRTHTTWLTQVTDCNAMTLQVADLIGIPPVYIRHKVFATWENGITFGQWLDKVVPPSQPLQGVWL